MHLDLVTQRTLVVNGDVTSRLPQLRGVLTGRKSAGFARDQAVAREFLDVRGRLSVAQHERPAALNRRSMVSSASNGAAVGRRPSGGSYVGAAGRCGPAASHSSRSGWVTLPRAMSRSCAYLRTLRVTGPWRSAGDPARHNSAAASRGLRIYADLLRIRHESTYADDRIMPTVAWCASFGLPAARARLCRAVGATGTSRRPADSSPTPRTGFDLPQREGAGRWGLTR